MRRKNNKELLLKEQVATSINHHPEYLESGYHYFSAKYHTKNCNYYHRSYNYNYYKASNNSSFRMLYGTYFRC